MTKLIIAGGRDYQLTPQDYERLDGIPMVKEVISGTARGADTCGEQWAERKGIPVKRFPADWEKFGKTAGIIRNSQMAQYAASLGPGGSCALFPGGRGTDNMHLLAEQHGLIIYDWRGQSGR